MKQFLFVSMLLLLTTAAPAQAFITRDIKSFGAKGDGKTNDHEAFAKAAAFFNARGGKGKLVISKGVYIVGRQVVNKANRQKAMYTGEDVLVLDRCVNLTIEGVNSTIRFRDSLRYGSFEPLTGKVFRPQGYFVDGTYAASAGRMIYLTECNDVTLLNLKLDGNNGGVVLGGSFGDTGFQIPYIGIHALGCRNLLVNNCNASYFGLDGIMIGNIEGGKACDKTLIRNSVFEYNSRQGLSWTGGTNLTAIGCKFNHTGRGKFQSAPGAGVDIEAETGDISGGIFNGCEFINNTGCGLVADSGPSSNCIFTNCLFWGTTNWSVWITKPGFSIVNSRIYGSIVHGFSAASEKDATKYTGCHFEDKPYEGKEPFGNFLVETNGVKRMRFENCTMLAHRKRIVWMESSQSYTPAEKYQVINCSLTYDGNNFPVNEWICLTRSVHMQNSTFTISHPEAKAKNYWFNSLFEPYNSYAGNNRLVMSKEVKSF